MADVLNDYPDLASQANEKGLTLPPADSDYRPVWMRTLDEFGGALSGSARKHYHEIIVADAVERGYPVSDRVQGQNEGPAGADNTEASPGTEPEQATPKPKQRKLPDDIPDTIEVGLGHFKGWATATAEQVKGRRLHYCLAESDETGKVQVISCSRRVCPETMTVCRRW